MLGRLDEWLFDAYWLGISISILSLPCRQWWQVTFTYAGHDERMRGISGGLYGNSKLQQSNSEPNDMYLILESWVVPFSHSQSALEI